MRPTNTQNREPTPPPEDGAPTIEVRRSARRKRTVQAYRQGDRIVVLVPTGLSGADERRYVDRLVARVMGQRSRAVRDTDEALAERARQLSRRYLQPALGASPTPRSVSWVDNQHKRWGSCTIGARTIRLSERLRSMPDWVVDYVLVHELAHLVHADHSAQFWDLVASYPMAERARGFLEGFSAAAGEGGGAGADAD